MEGYAIDYITGSSKTTELLHNDFSEIKEMAVRVVENGGAERVEVRNSDGQLVFHYPRVMHRA